MTLIINLKVGHIYGRRSFFIYPCNSFISFIVIFYSLSRVEQQFEQKLDNTDARKQTFFITVYIFVSLFVFK